MTQAAGGAVTIRPRLYMVVPVFNEVDNLERLFGAFRTVEAEFGARYRLQFVMVDDGSTDGSPERASALASPLDFVLLRNRTNQGPGGAFGAAFEYLASRLEDVDWVVTLEGDNTSRHELLRQMFRRAEEGYEVVLASPYMYGGGITNTSALRVFLSHMANAFVKEFLGAHGILTLSSFFRLYRAPVLKALQATYGPRILERPGFECMVELLLKLIYLGTTISEVPMVLDTSLRAGSTKMRIGRTIVGYVGLYGHLGHWRTQCSRTSPVRNPVA
ncbi:MAG: glycosyltransferase family 2 protein [Chloroflexi bacterium]|nr:glycosyltransferase family 2 protein [Chloroflexota bacterium]